MVCTGCGGEIGEGQIACGQCGRPVSLQTDRGNDPVAGRPIRAKLTVFRGDAEGEAGGEFVREVDLTGQDIVIGRLPSADITLEGDGLVSRRHVRLYAKRGVYHLVDLDSSNGTLVDGAEVTGDVALAGGERIAVGGYEIRYDVIEAASAPASEAGQGALWTVAVDSGSHAEAAPAVLRADWTTIETREEMAVGQLGQDRPVGQVATPSFPFASPLASSRFPAGEVPAANDHSDRSAEIEVLKEQVRVLAAMVQQRAERDAQLVESLRGALIHTRAVLTGLLNTRESGLLSAAAETHSLLTLARETAQNPTHIQYVSRFAEHAGEIAVVLEHLDRSGIGRNARRTLRELLDQLDIMLQSQSGESGVLHGIAQPSPTGTGNE